MKFSKVSFLSILALSFSAMAVPAEIENIEISTVIGGQLLAGAAKAAVDVAKAALEPGNGRYKDFNEAREAFTKEMVKGLWTHRYPRHVKGVAYFNGPYTWSPGSVYEGPIDIDYKWDIYHTDYDCFEVISGTVVNRGNGAFINVAYVGCSLNGKTFTC